MGEINPETFTEREKEIARVAYGEGYAAADKFWKNRTTVSRRLLVQLQKEWKD